MTPIIEVKNLSKQYRIGQRQSYLSLRDALVDKFKFRQNKAAHHSQTMETDFWALNDISFDVQAGESIGIIGRNGAGKSTLLKILSRITPPTKGKAILRGRMASLLEVGTGFHPELTGRENVYFNASILGLRKAEVVQKFDEIVAFSGVEQFIDTPLKHYSSGMQLRLAFAVAAHLEPEILVIDEVLAVGDAEFQKKCLGKMDEVSKSGRTVIFVSHNLTMVKSLCQRGLLLEQGHLVKDSDMQDCIDAYLKNHQAESNKPIIDFKQTHNPSVEVTELTINGSSQFEQTLQNGQISLEFLVKGRLKSALRMDLEVKIFDKDDVPLAFYSPSLINGTTPLINEGGFEMRRRFNLPQNMNEITFYLDIALAEPGRETHVFFPKAVRMTYEGTPTQTGHILHHSKGAGWFYLNDCSIEKK